MFGGSTCGQHVANICTQLSMCGDHGLVGIIVWQLGAAVSHYWVVALVHLFVKCDIFKFLLGFGHMQMGSNTMH